MAANADWPRWIFASIAYRLKTLATANSIPVLVEHLDERSESFMLASDRVEIRITGPFSHETSKDCHHAVVDVNVLLTSRYDGEQKNPYTIFKQAGLFYEAMTAPIPVWNYGDEPGDYVDDEPATHLYLGCLTTQRPTKVFHFGQNDLTEKLKQSVVDARYEIDLYQ